MEARLAKQGRELALLRAQIDQYETALRGSNVTVFSQDRDLRYTTISNSILGREIEDILGKTDADIMSGAGRDEVIALKQSVMDSGEATRREITLGNEGRINWFDLHIEPLRADSGEVIGLTCAAIDITERKESEAHLRLLMRELTHRSKNLLAVIQAMARQTAKFSGSTERFLEQFNARLQALAASHDLLVHESWRGVPLDQLIRAQLGRYTEGSPAPASLTGPAVVLKPDAGQSLGLALHELMVNAGRHGALSAPGGRVAISWRRQPASDGFGLELLWAESGGPAVSPPKHSGFGTLVIDHNLARSLDADVALSYETPGLRCRIAIPVTQLLPGG